MAKTQNTLIGRSSGSVGGATFSTWKGINVLKSKPLTVANPKTAGQVATRNMFTALVRLYREIANVVKIGFNSQAVKKSEFNEFLSTAMRAGLPIQIGATFLDWADLMDATIAKGSMAPTVADQIVVTAATSEVTIDWPTDIGVGQSANDEFNLVIIDSLGVLRFSGTSLKLRNNAFWGDEIGGALQVGDNLHIYYFFRNPETGDVNDSVYQRVAAV